jgi:hypothetical protein
MTGGLRKCIRPFLEHELLTTMECAAPSSYLSRDGKAADHAIRPLVPLVWVLKNSVGKVFAEKLRATMPYKRLSRIRDMFIFIQELPKCAFSTPTADFQQGRTASLSVILCPPKLFLRCERT